MRIVFHAVLGVTMKYIFVLLVCVAFSGDVWAKKVHHGEFKHGGKIVGGTNATSIDMFPYQAYLLLKKGDDYYQCGGVIISDKAILTAAHCLKGIEKTYIRIGSINSDSGGKEYESSNFRIHPLYNSKPNDYDIAMILLSQKMTLDGKNTKAVKLPKRNAHIPGGTALKVSGWGTTTENGDTSSTLMDVEVPALTNEQCSHKLNGITPRMVCAGEDQGGKDSCQGDSGGPAVNKENGELLGIVSFGVGCGRPDLPGVYARVPALRSWIRMNAGV